jgi:hypothetical protein
VTRVLTDEEKKIVDDYDAQMRAYTAMVMGPIAPDKVTSDAMFALLQRAMVPYNALLKEKPDVVYNYGIEKMRERRELQKQQYRDMENRHRAALLAEEGYGYGADDDPDGANDFAIVAAKWAVWTTVVIAIVVVCIVVLVR